MVFVAIYSYKAETTYSYMSQQGERGAFMAQISVADFAKERGQERDTINAYIRRNLKDVPGLTRQNNNGNRLIDVDSEAYRILDAQYPKMETLEIITADRMQVEKMKAELEEKREANERMQAMIARYQEMTEQLESKVQGLLQEREDMVLRLGQAQSQTLLLADKESQISKLQEKAHQADIQAIQIEEKEKQLQEQKNRGEQQQEQIIQLQAEIMAKDKELDRISKMSLWQRIFGF